MYTKNKKMKEQKNAKKKNHLNIDLFISLFFHHFTDFVMALYSQKKNTKIAPLSVFSSLLQFFFSFCCAVSACLLLVCCALCVLIFCRCTEAVR
ncbi:hypothetical protein ES332_D13G183900v1 [Gossypium tomentosum]|uniref:Uncharacterized protein n=1 Tax=Gossypium tomentosum TaxID=34277 RepID=A0A5D2HYC9_GOSTO|nr:hypothetical protein ES332_D13G183900v1 [Gossypium tomentosum]